MGRLTRLSLLFLLSLGAGLGAFVMSGPASQAHPLGTPRDFAPVAPATLVAAGPTEVTVKAGDSLSAIGTALNLTWQQLAGWNHLSWSQAQNIMIGQVLKVPATDYVPPVLNPPAPPPAPVQLAAEYRPSPAPTGPPVGPLAAGGGIYSYAALESLWMNAGGPSWAAPKAAQIAQCESGGKPWAYNPSGATGLWQILGAVVPGNLYDPGVNAANAVAKFHDAGNSFSPWVCQ